jgi:carboxyl-terminal processing protease
MGSAAPNGKCRTKESSFKPLFSVNIGHEFPTAPDTFKEVKDLILENYYNENITEEALYWAAIQGMLRHISPPENPELGKIWLEKEYKQVRKKLQGVQVSLGIKSSFNTNDGSLTVLEIFPDSPADAILKPMDRILRINSEPLKGKSVTEVNTLLKGEEETEITLTINRDIQIFDVTLTFKQFETQNLIVTKLTKTIGLVEIKKFTAGMSKKIEQELEKLEKEGIEGIIIDLRNNSGGVFIETLRVVELFLPEKRILLKTFQREKKLQNYVSVNKKPFTFKISILTNKNTASAAEIFAASLQDHQKALIVGVRTYGKAVFEKTFTLQANYRVKFITGAMYSPKGESWQSKGITPDFLVEQDIKTLEALHKIAPKERLRKDVAMITALKLLNR